MRTRFVRQLRPSLNGLQTGTMRAAFAATDGGELQISIDRVVNLPPEQNARDYTIMLLQIGAQIEHALMVEYLYAAYSLGGPQVPPEYQQMVQRWQEVILGIAKEEMGHLISVQNILRLIGGPLNLDREDYPFSSAYYPFPFKLEPISLGSLAKYTYAEMGEKNHGKWADELKRMAEIATDGAPLNHVSKLYSDLMELVRTPEDGSKPRVPDSDFDATTYPFQASWDEWGRSYYKGARGNTPTHGTQAVHNETPDVLVKPLASRDDALAALKAIAEQGESPLKGGAGPSHFERFLEIYKEYKESGAGMTWSATRHVPSNPVTALDIDGRGSPFTPDGALITHPEAILWAQLFNVRYRMLLLDISHTYLLSEPLLERGLPTARGALINMAFGEMYNIRSIANILVRTPRAEDGSEDVAGPTFEMPYTLDLPEGERNRWRVHRDLLAASAGLVNKLTNLCSAELQGYLRTLEGVDTRTSETVEAMINGNFAARKGALHGNY